jgi:hypothetical protein
VTEGGRVGRGFASVSGAYGTLVAYATQPDRVAADGEDRNSPFTKALLKHLPTPGVELRTLMTRVARRCQHGDGRRAIARTLRHETNRVNPCALRVGGSTFDFGSLKPAGAGAFKQKTGANSQDGRQGP